MVIKLKCKKCNHTQILKYDDITQDMAYKCVRCTNIMSMRDSTKFSNLLTLDNFDILGMYDDNIPTNRKDFECCIDSIKEIYNNSDKENKELILATIENFASILMKSKVEYTLALHNSVHNSFLEMLDKEHADMGKILNIK